MIPSATCRVPLRMTEPSHRFHRLLEEELALPEEPEAASYRWRRGSGRPLPGSNVLRQEEHSETAPTSSAATIPHMVGRRRQPPPEKGNAFAARAEQMARAATWLTQTLEDYTAIQEELEVARSNLRAAIALLHETGASYDEIGAIMGVSRQRVQQLAQEQRGRPVQPQITEDEKRVLDLMRAWVYPDPKPNQSEIRANLIPPTRVQAEQPSKPARQRKRKSA